MACPAQALAIEYCATKGFWVLEGTPSSCGGLNPVVPHAVKKALHSTKKMAALGIDGSFISLCLCDWIREQLKARLPISVSLRIKF
jgi:hypothetical protein